MCKRRWELGECNYCGNWNVKVREIWLPDCYCCEASDDPELCTMGNSQCELECYYICRSCYKDKEFLDR